MTTTGNTVAVALSKASQEPDSRESQCKEMAKRNEENRKNAPGKLEATKQNEHRKSYVDKIDESLDKLDGGGMTFASAFVDVGIGGGERLRGMMSACSDAKTQECLQDALVPGGTDEMRAGTQTILCEDAAYAHPGGGFGSHAEAKILNEVTSMAKGRNLAGGSIMFRTDWHYDSPKGGTYSSGMPCAVCYRAMCAATDCGIDIYLCNAKSEPVRFNPDGDCKKEKKKSDPRDDSWDRLDRAMGEDPLTGRGVVL
ncbi:hypothetical protein [Caballeronia sp. M1242]|uniref:hypothetical protein n=1 Tax=Caballeronia sp. M1242 TaxID=2814653 RepID=UPI0019D27527|nr:hypothetical protein [Caballeronia sp. M1242]QSN64241.1 hypothetical protein JYK05_23350 [Caballeronia sp. M1242]